MHQSLIGLDLEELVALARAAGEPAYRGTQIYQCLYRDRKERASRMTTLPRTLREALARDHDVGLPRIANRFPAADGTVRYLLRLEDRRSIEAVFIPESSRDTLCISTQVGCPVDCKFCLTALMGLERNLTAGEIVGQVLALANDQRLDPRSRRLNVVMMGMGEPLLNLEAVMKATRLLADPKGVAVPQRRITVSTAGVVPKIAEFGSHAVRGKLAISLNASGARQREKLMPITKRFGLGSLLAACRGYPLRRWERLTFEYVLLAGVNDSDSDARAVRRLLSGLKCMVNLIAFNPGPGIPFETPEPGRVEAFQSIVREGIPCFVRKPRGLDVFAACGQLKRTTDSPSSGSGPPNLGSPPASRGPASPANS